MLNRRAFIRKASIGAGLALAGGFPLEALAAGPARKLTILHTNDTHSRLEPFPNDSGKYSGQGGVAARATLINRIRKEQEHVLLFDAGDIFQGTPYFNRWKGEPEIKALSLMGYDAVTMGNHDFDAGVDGFALQLQYAKFPVVVSNYDFTDTPLEGKTLPCTTIKKGGVKVGIFGLGIELSGLVSDNYFGNTKYLDPLPIAKRISEQLKKQENCELVVCLSHLGYEYDSSKISDKILAAETEHIDLIIGGHTHTFLDAPTTVRNKAGREVLINQAGWAGLRLGCITYSFESGKQARAVQGNSIDVKH